mgnify:FL=1
MLSLIVAKGKNNEIGKDNKLLWDLPEDMKNFRKLTNGKTVIMGRKTYESIGRLLPNRLNVVVSSTMEDPNIKNLVIFRSLEDVYFHYQRYAGEIFVLGGSSIYEYFKDKCDKLYITDVNDTYAGADIFFPEIDMSNYNVESSVDYDGFKITEYKKIDKMIESGMGNVVQVLEKLGAESLSVDIENQEVAFILNDKKYLYKVNLNILSKELWKTYYSPYWFKLYTEELNTLTYNINKGLVDNPKIVEQREEYKIKDRELKIWQEPGFAVLIAITLILGGYLIGAFL